MTNLPTNYHNFEIQKENIRKFSNKILEPVELKAVDEKFLWKFDHRLVLNLMLQLSKYKKLSRKTMR